MNIDHLSGNYLSKNSLESINNKHYIIYKITNIITNQFYIGKHSTTNINDNYMGSGQYIIAAEQKYGLLFFIKEILYECETEELAYTKEAELVQLSNCYPYDKLSYNLVPGGLGAIGSTLSGENHPFFGKHHTEESKLKNRISHLGKPSPTKGKKLTAEQRLKISQHSDHHEPWNKGKHLSKETKQKISNANKGRIQSEQEKNNRRGKTPWNKGKPTADYIKQKLSKSNTGRKHTLEEIEKQKQAQCGRKLSEGTKQKISNANKGRTRTLEQKLRQSLLLKGKRCGKESKTYGMKWMFNPITKHKIFVKPNNFDKYINNGYHFGMK